METSPANPLAPSHAKLSLVNTTTTRFLFWWQPRPPTVVHLRSSHPLHVKPSRTCMLDTHLTNLLLCLRDWPAVLFLSFFPTTTRNIPRPAPHSASATASSTVLEFILTNFYSYTHRTEPLFVSRSFRKNSARRSYVSFISGRFLLATHAIRHHNTDLAINSYLHSQI